MLPAAVELLMVSPFPFSVGLIPVAWFDWDGVWEEGNRVAKCISWRGRDGGAGGVDDEEFPRPEINLRQYFSSRSRCTHVLSAPVFPPQI